jgi:guanylate kinase
MKSNYSPIVISGPSGAGKSELIDFLEKKDEIFMDAPGVTTRAKRENEMGNIEFISIDEFKRLIENDKLIQYAKYNGNYYGTLKSSLKLLQNRQLLFNIGLEGAKKIKQLCPNSQLIYILPPNKDEIIRRMGNRGSERYEIGVNQTMNSIDLYDYLLISYTNELENIYEDFMNIYENKSNEKSLKLTRNRNFMRDFYK